MLMLKTTVTWSFILYTSINNINHKVSYVSLLIIFLTSDVGQ